MYNNSETWLDMETVCSLTNEVKETVRRKCKSGKYSSTSIMKGHSRIYKILLSSLSKVAQEKYFELHNNSNLELENITKDSEDYAKAPAWARKQADKYLFLFNATRGMNTKELKAFLNNLKEKGSEDAVSFQAYYKAKKRYQLYGVAVYIRKRKTRKN